MGERIRELRTELDLTQQDLADLLEVDRSAIAHWELGNAVPTADKLPKLAEVLKCSIDELFRRPAS